MAISAEELLLFPGFRKETPLPADAEDQNVTVCFFPVPHGSNPGDLARYTWNARKKSQKLAFCELTKKSRNAIIIPVISKTLMTDGIVEHHME